MWRLLGALLLLTACVGRPAADASGEEIFAQLCAQCHGVDLEGGLGPAVGAGSQAASEPDEFIRIAVRGGLGRMPSMKNALTSEQLELLIAFIRSEQ